MKITIWSGCKVEQELTLGREDEGPHLHIDPYNLPNSMSVARTDENGWEYRQHFDLPTLAELRP